MMGEIIRTRIVRMWAVILRMWDNVLHRGLNLIANLSVFIVI